MTKTERIFIKDLNARDQFFFPGSHTLMTATSVFTEGNATRVEHRIQGIGNTVFAFVRVNLATVDRVI
jgi:hypothetical protein